MYSRASARVEFFEAGAGRCMEAAGAEVGASLAAEPCSDFEPLQRWDIPVSIVSVVVISPPPPGSCRRSPGWCGCAPRTSAWRWAARTRRPRPGHSSGETCYWRRVRGARHRCGGWSSHEWDENIAKKKSAHFLMNFMRTTATDLNIFVKKHSEFLRLDGSWFYLIGL